MRDRPARAFVVLLALACGLYASETVADHCSEGRQADGRSDSTLAGVRVLSGAVLEVTQHLGPPTSVETFPDGTYPGSGEREYIWQRRFERVVVTTMYAPRGSEVGPEEPYSVELMATAGPRRAVKAGLGTQRGIRLGAGLRDVVAAYGSQYYEDTVKGKKNISYCWMDDTWLTFEFDDAEAVSRVHLLGSVE